MVEEEEEDPPPYASLIAISDDAKSILHVDQSTKQFDKFGIKKVPLNGPTISLRYSNSILGRILMAKDNVTRAKTQVADLALDLPSGELWIFFSLLFSWFFDLFDSFFVFFILNEKWKLENYSYSY